MKKVGDSAFCQYCYVTLANNKTLLKRHEETASHKKKQSQYKTTHSIIDVIQKSSSVQGEFSKLKIEMTLTMYCLKNHLTFSIMDSLPELLKVVSSDSIKGINCKRTKATALVNNILGPYSLEKLSKYLRNHVFSLIIDETTDVSTTKSLVLVVRLFDNESQKIKDQFFALLELKNADAESIYSVIMNKLEHQNIPLKNMIGLASDNASVMSGNINGVRTKLQQNNDTLFYLGCMCHSLHLIASSSSKILPAHIEKNIKNIYSHFAHSAKRQDEFKDFQELFDVMQHKILGLSVTRWLSYENVINRTLEQWQPLMHYFLLYCFEESRIKSSNAKDILEFLQNSESKLYLYFLSYVLKLINKLNKMFQSEVTKIHVIIPTMTELMHTILKNFIKPEYCKNININYNDNHFQIQISSLYCGLEFETCVQENKLDSSTVLEVKKNILKFYIEMCHQIKRRINFSDEKLSLLKYVDPEQIATGELQCILPLLGSFPYYEKSFRDILNDQWRNLIGEKELIIQNKGDNIVSTWINLGKIKNPFDEFIYKELSEYMLKLAVLPHSSAAAERIFSDLNLFKTKKTNRLSMQTTENILLSKLLIDFEKEAIWTPSDELLKYASKFSYHSGEFKIKQ